MTSIFNFKKGKITKDDHTTIEWRYTLKKETYERIMMRLWSSHEYKCNWIHIKIKNELYRIYPSITGKTVELDKTNTGLKYGAMNKYDEYSIVFDRKIVYFCKEGRWIDKIHISEYPLDIAILGGGRMIMENLEIQ